MQHSPSCETNQFSASQIIPRILQMPATCPFPEPDQNSWRSILILSSHLHLGLSLGFTHQKPVYAFPLPHTYYMVRLLKK